MAKAKKAPKTNAVTTLCDEYGSLQHVVEQVDNTDYQAVCLINAWDGKVLTLEAGKYNNGSAVNNTIHNAEVLVKEIQKFIDRARKLEPLSD